MLFWYIFEMVISMMCTNGVIFSFKEEDLKQLHIICSLKHTPPKKKSYIRALCKNPSDSYFNFILSIIEGLTVVLCFLFNCSTDRTTLTVILFLARALGSGIFQTAYVYTPEVMEAAKKLFILGWHSH